MVQNGKFAACAAAVLVKALNKVDLPTFGNPTIPILNPMALLLLALLRASSGRSAPRQAAKMQKRCSATYGFFYGTSFFVKCLLGIDFSHAIGHGRA
jgi:hypothetical protein